MSFTDPSTYFSGQSRSPLRAPSPAGVGTPFYPALPKNTKAFLNKYQALAPILPGLPAPVRNAIIAFDAQRVATGGRPLTEEQTIGALRTAITGQPATPPPDRSPWNIIGNITKDAKQILTSIPRIPSAVVHAVQNPSEMVNFIPGYYVGQQLARGGEGVRELTTHPLMSALDVMPLAAGAASGSKVVKAISALGPDEAWKAARLAPGARIRPLTTYLSRRVDDTGAIVPRRGAAIADILRTETRIGQRVDQAIGKESRMMMQQRSMQDAYANAQRLGWIDEGTSIESATRGALQLEKDFPEILADTGLVAKLADRSQLDDLVGLKPREVAYIQRAREIATEIGEHAVSVGDLGKFLGEFYPSRIANRMKRLTYTATMRREHAFARDQVLNPTLAADDYTRAAIAAIDSPGLPRGGLPKPYSTGGLLTGISNKERRLRVRESIFALDGQGYDTTALRALETKAHNTGDWQQLRAQLTQPLTKNVTYTPAEIITTLRGRGEPMAERLATAITSQNGPLITKTLDQLMSRSKFILPELDEAFVRSIRSYRDRTYFVNENLAKFTDKLADQTTRKAESYIADNAPARYQPLIQQETARRVIQRYAPAEASRFVARDISPAQAGSIAELVWKQRYHKLPDYSASPETLLNDIAAIKREVTATWTDMQARGLDPGFVHTVTPSAMKFGPRVTEIPNTITQVKDRLGNYTAGVQDVTVALSHQGMEYLSRARHEVFLEFVVKKFGRSVNDVRDEMSAMADAARLADPRLPPVVADAEAIARKYTLFDPDTAGYTWGSKRLNTLRDNQIYIPNAIARNMKLANNPKSLLGGAFDGVNKIFRVAVIGLSVRTHLYNVVGNNTMMLGRGGPAMYKYARQANAMARRAAKGLDPGAPEGLTLLLTQSRKAFTELDRTTQSQLLTHAKDVLVGKSLRRVWDSVQAAKTGKVAALGSKLVQKSYDWNSIMDDTFRGMAYMFERDRMLARGVSTEVADAAAVGLTRRVLMDYAGMTPWELATMKSIVPFYSFIQHSVRYAATFPVDHPMRAFILSKLSEIEAKEIGDTLPSRFLASLPISAMDVTGDKTLLSLAAVNPFGDVANMFTLSGWLGATNPAIQTLLESVGVERGEAEMYPSLRYNPETGRLATSHRNPLLALAENIVPQTQILTAVTGFNTEFNERILRDPVGAQRMLWSAVNLPILWREYNIPQEQFKAEVARQDSAADVRNNALRSGDWSNALRYPSLREYYAQLTTLGQSAPGALTQFTPSPALQETLISIASQPRGTIGTPNLAASSGPGV